MTPEIWTIIGVGVAIAALILAQARHSNRLIETMETRMSDRIETMETRTSDRIETMETRTNDRIGTMETRMNDRFQSFETQIAELRERMAHLEGLLEGLREAIAGRRAA